MPEDEGRQDAPHGASPAADGPAHEQPNLSPWSSPAPDAPPPAPGAGDPFATEQLSSSLPPDAGSDQPYGPPPPAPPYGSPYGSPPASPYGSPQGQGGAPGYGPPPYGAPPAPPTAYGPGYGAAGYGYGGPRTSSNATVVMVCGIASIVLLFTCGLGFIPAIVALVRAPSARREIIASNGQLSGLGMITAGRITAWTTIGLTILAILALVLLITVGNMFDPGSDFGDDGFSASAR